MNGERSRRATRRIAEKLAALIAVLFLVTVASFSLVNLLPGDPSLAVLPPGASAELTRQVRDEFGLNANVATRYTRWVGRVAHGDLGTSSRNGEAVSTVLRRGLTVTGELIVTIQVFAILVGVVLGALAAHRAGSRFDRVVQIVTFAVQAIPQFAVALVLLLVFGVRLHWFPTVGFVHLGDDLFGNFRSLAMPTLTLGIPLALLYARILRTEMITTLASDHVLLSRAHGIPERRIVVRHALRESSFSLLTLFGIEIGTLLGGALIIERIFALPGMGRLMIESVGSRDYLVVQGGVLVVGAGFVVANALTDLARSLVDPRVRIESNGG